MATSAVRVVLRARPSDKCTQINFLPDKKGISIVQQKVIEGRPGGSQPAAQSYQFKFDNVLASASQEEVYEAAASEVVRGALEGFNGTIMCYGQTGAGKTFTMSGGKQNYKQRGVIPRALSQVFAEVKALPDRKATVSIQYLEIYNEALYDLLDITTQPHEISIYESSRGLVTVSGLRTAVVATEAEALALLFEGETNRVIGEHQLNRESSRSHSIFTISLEIKSTSESGGGDVLLSKVALVDLAGSERVSKTRSEGLVLREAGHINKSLSILEQVILGLGDKNREHVPFRSSKLTHVLKNSLGGNCRTVLVANVWSDAAQTDETLSTCRFAQRMMRVTCEVSANVQADSSARVRQLERQVADLKQELAMHDAMAMRSGVSYSPYTEVQRAELRSRVRDFLMTESPGGAGTGAGVESIEPLELHSLRHMKEILFACRHLYWEALRGTRAPLGTDNGGGTGPSTASRAAPGPPHRPSSAGSSGGASVRPTSAARRPSGIGILHQGPWVAGVNGSGGGGGGDAPGVGDVEQPGGAGVAPDDARPDSMGAEGEEGPSLAERLLSQQQAGTSGGAGRREGGGRGGSLPPGVAPPDRLVALEDYKVGPGATLARLLADNRAKLRASRARAKELGLTVNAASKELEGLKARGEQLKKQRVGGAGGGQWGGGGGGEGGGVLDAEEYDVLLRIRELKAAYKEAFGELQLVRSEVDYTQGLVDQCNKELLMEFTEWYTQTYGRPPADTNRDDGGGGEDGGLPSSTRAAPPLPRIAATTGPPPSSAQSRPSLTPPSPSASSLSSSSATTARGGGRPSAAPGGGASSFFPSSRPRANSMSANGGPTGGGKVPLSSLVSAPAEELSSPEALAYYSAQQLLLQKTSGVAHRPGSVKKSRPVAAFGGSAKAGSGS